MEQPPSDSTPFEELVPSILSLVKRDANWLKTETKTRAEKIAEDKATYDELCWFLAEADLNLRIKYQLKTQKKFSSQTLASASDTNVKYLAEVISAYHNKLDDLHWLLAERKLLLDALI
jgi:hypothetical protein